MTVATTYETVPGKPASVSSSPGKTRLGKIWTAAEAAALYRMPFNDLLFKAQTIHREHFDPNRVQLSRLLNIKTGGCPEDCAYCSQSVHHESGLTASKLMEVERVIAEAKQGARRRRDPLLHGRGVAQSEAARHGSRGGDGEGRQGARHGNLHDARHARSCAVRAIGRSRASIITTTTSIRRSATTARSSPHVILPIASIRSTMCATPA